MKNRSICNNLPVVVKCALIFLSKQGGHIESVITDHQFNEIEYTEVLQTIEK